MGAWKMGAMTIVRKLADKPARLRLDLLEPFSGWCHLQTTRCFQTPCTGQSSSPNPDPIILSKKACRSLVLPKLLDTSHWFGYLYGCLLIFSLPIGTAFGLFLFTNALSHCPEFAIGPACSEGSS
jgi:hypothetical protein